MKKNSWRLFWVNLLILVILAVVSTSCEPASPTDSSGDESSESDVLYELVVSVSPPESGTLFPAAYSGEEYTEGTQVTITAFPNEGYSFSHWSGDAAGETNPIIVTMDSNKKVWAEFIKESDEPPIFTVYTYVIPNVGGHILPSIPPEGRAYPANTRVALTAVPDEGYAFRVWTHWKERPRWTFETTTYVVMDSDKFLSVEFYKKSDEPVMYELTVVVEPEEGGSVYLKDVGKIPTGFGFEYVVGTKVHLTATPNEGYRFAQWKVIPWENVYAFQEGSTYLVTMSEDKTVYAYFEKIPEEPQDKPLPPLQETLYVSFDGGGQCTATQSLCSCNLSISIEGKDLTGGSYPVTNVTLTVNGGIWDDSGNISETHYTKTVERVVDCDKTFNIEVTATNSIGQTVSSTGSVTTARP